MGKYIIKGSNYGFLLSLLLILGHSTSSNSSECPIICVQAENGCKVCFQACSKNNTITYQFASCSQNQINSLQNSKQSQLPQNTVNYDLTQCGIHCCDDRYKIFENTAVTSCPISSNNQKPVVIIVISILTAVFVALCCCVSGNSKMREKIIKCICKEKAQKVERSMIISNNSAAMIAEVIISQDRRASRASQVQAIDNICSICLQGRSNTSTLCGHHYHFRCIYEWGTRKPECPLCKSNKIRNVFIYCHKCLNHRAEVPLLEVPFLSLGRFSSFECQKCRTS